MGQTIQVDADAFWGKIERDGYAYIEGDGGPFGADAVTDDPPERGWYFAPSDDGTVLGFRLTNSPLDPLVNDRTPVIRTDREPSLFDEP